MSRGHVQGFDSNAAQFERMGNPWVSERERQEFSAPSRAHARQNRNPKRPQIWEISQKPVSSRADSPGFKDYKRRCDFVAMALSRIGGSRTSTPTIAKPDGQRVDHAASRELKPLTSAQLEQRRLQREAVAARLEAGERAYQASEAAKAAERRQVEARIAALEERLERL